MTEQNDKIISYIRLINSAGIGPVKFYQLLKKYGTAEVALSKIKEPCSPEAAQKELETATNLHIKMFCFDDNEYPQKLKILADCPPVLYILGNTEILKTPHSIGIVGGRNASISGRKLASRIAYDLAGEDVLVVSGMARGIDSAAHKGAMYASGQHGKTLAVLGTGINICYPPENKSLYEQIKNGGVIISEFALGAKANAGNFPRRNRLVAAMSDAVLVVEAGLDSGSLITANLAQKQNKQIFAVPGSPNDERALGANKLIQNGAILTNSAADILPKFGISKKVCVDKNKKSNDIPTNNILNKLDYVGLSVDNLVRLTGLNSSELALELLQLELSGKIERLSGGKVALKK